MGTYWMAQACGRLMRPGAAIINVSSVLGLVPSHLPQAAYAASKAGVLGLTRDLAQQWTLRRGIRVNALAPGYFPSEMTAQQDAAGALEPVVRERILMRRTGELPELCAALLFLASDAGSYVTASRCRSWRDGLPVTLPVPGPPKSMTTTPRLASGLLAGRLRTASRSVLPGGAA